MASERWAFLMDLHATTSGTDGGHAAVQDGSDVRIFSNWSARLNEFGVTAEKYNCDHVVLLGDILDNGDAAQTTVLASVCNEIEALVSSGVQIHMVPGNHDCIRTGALMQLGEFQSAVETEISGTKLPGITGSTKWPGVPVPGKHYVSYVSEGLGANTNFTTIHLWGSSAGGWDAADPANFAYVTGEGDIVRPQGDPKNQLDWLADTALAGIAKPVVVLCHESLAHRDGAATLSEIVVTTVQTTLAGVVTGGQPVNVFGGHYHRVFPTGSGHTWRKDTISGVNYYGLRGSVLGKHKHDMRGNTFYIVDIDTVAGVTNIKTFQYSNSIRDRYDPYDIDNVLKKGIRGRERVS